MLTEHERSNIISWVDSHEPADVNESSKHFFVNLQVYT